MRRIRLLLTMPKLVIGGAERQMLALAQGLDPRRFEVHIGVLAEGGGLWETCRRAGLRLHVFARAWRRDVSPILRIAAFCRHEDINILHSFLFFDGLYGRLAASLTGGVQTIASARGVEYAPRSPRAGMERLLARFSSCVVVNSEWMARRLRAEGYPPAALTRIPNGIDVARFAPGCVSPDAGLAEGVVIGTVGRMERVKDHATFLRAAALVAAEQPRVAFVIVGDGPEHEATRELAGRLGLADNLALPGAVEDVRPYLAAMRVFVLSSRAESLPGALLEAMSCGVPPVATAVGGVPEIVAPGRNGWLVRAGDAEGMAAGILGLLEGETARRRMGDAARQTVSDGFSLDTMIARYEDLYERLMRGTGR